MKTDKTIFVEGKERKIYIHTGYERFHLNRKGIFLHRYIWEEAYGKIPDGHDIHHKDENKLNNYYKNLEWLNDRGENIKYSMSKNILQIDPSTNNVINNFLTIKEAEKELNLPIGNISKCINGKRKTAGGYIWKLNN